MVEKTMPGVATSRLNCTAHELLYMLAI